MTLQDIKKSVLEDANIVNATDEDVAEHEKHDYLTINTGRDGRDYVWYWDGNFNIARDAETGKELSQADIKRLLED